MIINDLMQEFKDDDLIKTLKNICNKMKSELEYNIPFFETSEILYYYKFDDNKFFEKYLVLSYDMLNDDNFYIDVWQCNKQIYNNDNKLSDFEKIKFFQKLKSFKITTNHPKNILIEFAKKLKRLIDK